MRSNWSKRPVRGNCSVTYLASYSDAASSFLGKRWSRNAKRSSTFASRWKSPDPWLVSDTPGIPRIGPNPAEL